MNTNSRRTKLLVDRRLQVALLFHAVFHWTMFLTAGFGLLFLWEFLLSGPSESLSVCFGRIWLRYGPAVVVLIALLPVIVYDSLRLSHRVAGPMWRFRRELHRLAQGHVVRPIKFRRRDFWQDLATDFNELLSRMETHQSTGSHEEPDRGALSPPEHEPATA